MLLGNLDKYFALKVCIGITRITFFQRKQESELIDKYVSELCKLGIDCAFGGLLEEFIQDKVVKHAFNPAIQERLLMKGDACLNDVLVIVHKAETSSRCASALKTELKELIETLAKIKANRKYKYAGNKDKSEKESNKSTKYYRCGSAEQLTFVKYCPARKVQFGTCVIMGHYGKLCRKRLKSIKCVRDSDEANKDSSSSEQSSEEYCSDLRTKMTWNVKDGCLVVQNKPECRMKIGGVGIKVYADSGSPYFIINEEVWKTCFVNKVSSKLFPLDIDLEGYGSEKIDITGCRYFKFEFKNCSAYGKLYISKKGPSVLRLKDQKSLHISA
ncbi:hypothetical protein NDU88_006902 [Pleurodeles waltl]|uniref:Uncharacterized protein n=1 Tax=Pleurodeles waltl TaxID=8319 RepID=A0AAV7PNR1_PLEWA|nr:hypothetical protein NDU88_006902 [Pleurodeles waltl]